MRLQQYFKMWNSINEDESDNDINEFVDLNTKLKVNSEYEQYFWVQQDLYLIRILKKSNSHYELSLIHKDIEGIETSNLTNKNKPYKVTDGVMVAIKELIETKNPDIIEFNMFGETKKLKAFSKVMNYVLKKYPNTFGKYKFEEKETKLNMPYDLPDGVEEVLGMKYLMKKI